MDRTYERERERARESPQSRVVAIAVVALCGSDWSSQSLSLSELHKLICGNQALTPSRQFSGRLYSFQAVSPAVSPTLSGGLCSLFISQSLAVSHSVFAILRQTIQLSDSLLHNTHAVSLQ